MRALAQLVRIPASAALQGAIPVIALALFGAAAMIAKATPIPRANDDMPELILSRHINWQETDAARREFMRAASLLPLKDQSRIAVDTSPIKPGTVKTLSYRRPAGESIDAMRLASLVPVDREEERAARIVPDDVKIELPAIQRALDDPAIALAWARGYLLATATPGGTMTRQKPRKALECLHPEFARRLASAISDARLNGMTNVGVFSACRPPAFGVGGFGDKFNSLHAYGLAVDVYGIGGPGSRETRQWHSIARRHGVVCPYGPNNRAEFNHCQPTNLKIIARGSPLRSTITAKGPIDLEKMWQTAKSLIVSVAKAAAQPETTAERAKAKKTRTAKRTKKRRVRSS